MTFINSGSIISSSTSASGARCEAVYCGSTGGNDSFRNTGIIRGTAGGQGGWGVGCENDSVGQNFDIYNSGEITHNNGYGLYVQGYGTNTNGTLTITNTSSGTITGTLGCGSSHWNGTTIFDNSGAINGPIDLGPGNDTVYMRGSASITGTVRGNGGNDSLIFSLSGTLEQVNGQTATQGGNLANYSLGQSGNIVVSGKTYRWDSCTVSGTIGGTGGSGVTFYQNFNYGGTASQVIPVGDYTLSQLANRGVPNDWASSVRIPAGRTVIMYSNDNFSGTSWTRTADTPNFGSLSPNANDQMSSCRVQ